MQRQTLRAARDSCAPPTAATRSPQSRILGRCSSRPGAGGAVGHGGDHGGGAGAGDRADHHVARVVDAGVDPGVGDGGGRQADRQGQGGQVAADGVGEGRGGVAGGETTSSWGMGTCRSSNAAGWSRSGRRRRATCLTPRLTVAEVTPMATTPSRAARRPRRPPASATAAAMPSHSRDLSAACESRRTGSSRVAVGCGPPPRRPPGRPPQLLQGHDQVVGRRPLAVRHPPGQGIGDAVARVGGRRPLARRRPAPCPRCSCRCGRRRSAAPGGRRPAGPPGRWPPRPSRP